MLKLYMHICYSNLALNLLNSYIQAAKHTNRNMFGTINRRSYTVSAYHMLLIGLYLIGRSQ